MADMISKERLEKVLKALEKNNIKGYFVENRCKAVELVSSLIKKGSIVSFGGSVTLSEVGVFDLLKNGDYRLLDRNAEGNTPEDIQKIYRDSFNADTYLCSSNAITENGELYNVDGLANRISSIAFGPKKVVMIVGKNKIVPDLKEAFLRVKKIAAPKNCVRLNKNTPCAKLGHCVSLLNNDNPDFADGCNCDDRICCDYMISAMQRQQDRIVIIFVNEELGY